eukprot:CAMPEP_0182897740 /NCGR_PEP_ID=MMETSP0034_2-20130328/27071_1 /TAXON_ID=156128 /ORGANISM="Nephroselmis pyriformis, Strain CCMP717" /LENGTH=42 /DNA_ID= /DNA_START= /DNA_END= /DNA_ORIENTATION=
MASRPAALSVPLAQPPRLHRRRAAAAPQAMAVGWAGAGAGTR